MMANTDHAKETVAPIMSHQGPKVEDKCLIEAHALVYLFFFFCEVSSQNEIAFYSCS